MTLGKNKIDEFQSVVKNQILVSENDQYLTDWRGVFKGKTNFVIFPETTKEVSSVVELAAKNGIPIVPQGGNTGLCGGATPDQTGNSILMNLTKLNTIRSIDLTGNTITVEAGCILETIHNEVDKKNKVFPINLAAKGSCTIGGNLATNAGGNNVLKYGATRDLVLGIEAVLPDGKIINTLTALHKDNTGYALHKLLIGSEGTLAIITAATIRIFQKPKLKLSSFMKVKNIFKSIELLQYLKSVTGNDIEAFEIMTKPILEVVHRQFPKYNKPFDIIPEMAALVEFATTSDLDLKTNGKGETVFKNKVLEIMENTIEKNLIEDAVISQSDQQNKELWEIRENANIAQMQEGFQLKLDISIPLSRMAEFWNNTSRDLKKSHDRVKICVFGHLGDGNLHYNLMDISKDHPYVYQNQSKLKDFVYAKVKEFDGSFSAEHGIGQLKIQELKKYKDKTSLELMKKIKSSLDPNNILNPGKLFT